MKIGKKLTVEEVLSGNKMNLFVFLMLTWHYYSQALASPFAQTDDYYNYEGVYEDYGYDSDVCYIQELGIAGKRTQFLKSLFDEEKLIGF